MMKRYVVCRRCLMAVILFSLFVACRDSKTPKLDPDSPDALAKAGVSGNKQWSPWIKEQGGALMALVPAGCFMMGSTEEQIGYVMGLASSREPRERYESQEPAHQVCFERPFWIDVQEVSQGQFAAFGGQARQPSTFTGDALPRETISWYEAEAYCRTRGGRLPTEAEWEYAARGPDGLIFPWGDRFDCRRGNFDDETEAEDRPVIDGYPNCDGFPLTSPVGSLQSGVSWVGALDLSGNVWEWVADGYADDYYQRLGQRTVNPHGLEKSQLRGVRGGAWSINEADHLMAAFRAGIDPNSATEHLGFRCAMDFSG